MSGNFKTLTIYHDLLKGTEWTGEVPYYRGYAAGKVGISPTSYVRYLMGTQEYKEYEQGYADGVGDKFE